jgi:hypothetical protein
MPSSGGLLQLVAVGKQDVFLIGNPQISYFKMVYRRHTNFAVESHAMYFDGTPNFGQRITCLVPRRGDLLGKVYLDVTLPLLKDINGNELSYTNSIGHALIQEITFEIGEQEIDRQTGEWMEIWTQLTTPASQRYALNEMIGRIEPYNPINIIPGKRSDGLHLLIPLQFYFCKNPGMYIPLVALQYTPIRINITLRPLQQLFWIPPPPNPYNPNVFGSQDLVEWLPGCSVQVDSTAQIVNMMLWGDYVYLDVDERRSFSSTSHEYIIEQVQYTPPYSLTSGQTTATISVEFNHPLKEMIFVVQRDVMSSRNEWFNYSNLSIGEAVPSYIMDYTNSNAPSGRIDLISSAVLQLDGHDRFMARDASYFRLNQPYAHHTTTPVSSFIYNYCFALRPEDAQPTGTMNASRIDSIVWQIQMNPVLNNPLIPVWQQRGNCHIIVYARNYNIFRVINGFGGLVFTI